MTNIAAHKTTIALVLSLLFATNTLAVDAWEELALTPPLGWNSWNGFHCDVSEQLIRETVDAMVESGMRDAGYEYVVIDDCWQIGRDKDGNIIVDADRFPNGMNAVGDYIHAKGLKFGLYTDAGTKTCQGRPGSRGYEFQDFRQYAAWGVDYTKVDWCDAGDQNAKASFELTRDAIRAAGRPMVLSIVEWGINKPWLWGKGVGQLWRTTYDIADCWDCGEMIIGDGVPFENFKGFTKILDEQVDLYSYAGPGHWNDPDMLEVGNGGLTLVENRAHFSLWCVLAAPLMAGNDLRNMSEEVRSILTHSELLAVNQDPLGRQAQKVRDDGDLEVWSKQLQDGGRAVVLFNRSSETADIRVAWNEIGFPNHLQAAVRDLWLRKDMGKFEGSYFESVAAHGVVTITVQPFRASAQ